jgi:hypothetical protein
METDMNAVGFLAAIFQKLCQRNFPLLLDFGMISTGRGYILFLLPRTNITAVYEMLIHRQFLFGL